MGAPALLPQALQSLLARPASQPGQFRGSTVSGCFPLELGPWCFPPFPGDIPNENGGWVEEGGVGGQAVKAVPAFFRGSAALHRAQPTR